MGATHNGISKETSSAGPEIDLLAGWLSAHELATRAFVTPLN